MRLQFYVYQFFFLFSSSLLAQWNQNPAINNVICSSAYEQINPRIVDDLKGGAIIVWEDYRDDSTNLLANIYAQRINSNGVVMWLANGVAICTDSANQAKPAILQDSLGGAIIVWEDNRGLKRNLYAQKIDSNGIVQWAVNGVGVNLRNYDQKNSKLLNDGIGGAVVIWQDSTGSSYDVWAQRLDQNGNQQWPNGISLCTFSGSQINIKAAAISDSEIVATWMDKRNGADYDIYAQKFNLSGVVKWTINGIAVIAYADNQSNPKICSDNAGGVIIAWQDKRFGIDYDIYAKRINTYGNAMWPSTGIMVCNASGSQTALEITSYKINGAIISWKDARLGTTNHDIYSQKLDLNGMALLNANGILVTGAAANQNGVNCTSDGLGGAVFSYQDSSSGTWDIRTQRLTNTGLIAWGNGIDVGVAAGQQTNSKSIWDGLSGTIYAFEDSRSGTSDIYAYKVDSNGISVGFNNAIINESGICVYPNPSNGEINFDLTNKNTFEIANLTVLDAFGKEVLSHIITSDSIYVLKNKLDPGIYFFTILNKNIFIRGKFVAQN